MRTVIAPTGHVHDVVTREISDRDSARITRALAKQGIRVEPVIDIFHVLHLWPEGPLPTVLADQAIRAFAAATDARIFYHDPRPKPQPTCLMCGAGGQLTHELCGGCSGRLAQHTGKESA